MWFTGLLSPSGQETIVDALVLIDYLCSMALALHNCCCSRIC